LDVSSRSHRTSRMSETKIKIIKSLGYLKQVISSYEVEELSCLTCFPKPPPDPRDL
jgi:hypothetical protein